MTQVFFKWLALCVWGQSGLPPLPPHSLLHLHLIYIPLNTLWFDDFPLQITLIAASEAFHIASHCPKPVCFLFCDSPLSPTPPTLLSNLQPCLQTWIDNKNHFLSTSPLISRTPTVFKSIDLDSWKQQKLSLFLTGTASRHGGSQATDRHKQQLK